MTTSKTQHEQEPTRELPDNREKFLAILADIIRTYKALIVCDHTESEKLVRDFSKVHVTARSIVTKLNSSK